MKLVWSAIHDPYGAVNPLDDLQEVTISYGKRKFSDPQQTETVVLRGRDISSLPQINTYDQINIEAVNPANSYQIITTTGYVTDLELEYGIVPAQDVWTITVSQGNALLATTVIDTLSFADGDSLEDACTAFAAALPGSWSVGFAGIPDVRVSAQTLDGANANDVLTFLCNTGGLYASATDGFISFAGPYINAGVTPANFTDTGTGTNPYKYNRVRFSSLADNFAEVIEVRPDGLSPVQVGTGDRTVVFDTYNYDTAEATDLATYYSILYESAAVQPAEITFFYSMVPDTYTEQPAVIQGSVDVTMRGTTYNAVCIGGTITGTVSDTIETLYLYERDANNYLILDDPIYGRLDYNRLGF